MTYKQPSILDAIPKPVDGSYSVLLDPKHISVALTAPNGKTYAQATVALPRGLSGMPDGERVAKISSAAQQAARLINTWGELAKATEKALGVPVTLETKIVIEEEP